MRGLLRRVADESSTIRNNKEDIFDPEHDAAQVKLKRQPQNTPGYQLNKSTHKIDSRTARE